jgi:hypothetical protein
MIRSESDGTGANCCLANDCQLAIGGFDMGDYPGAEEHFVPRDWMFDFNAHSAIVIHKTAGDATPEDVLNTFMNSAHDPNPANRRRSAHYAVGQDGRIFQFVPEELGAGANGVVETSHAGFDPFWNPFIAQFHNLNTCTLSIEHCDPSGDNQTPLTPKQKEASFQLVAHLVKKYRIPASHIKPHSSIAATACPGNYPMDELRQFIMEELMIDLDNPTVARFFELKDPKTWKSKQTGKTIHGEILTFYRTSGNSPLRGLDDLGLPLSEEIPIEKLDPVKYAHLAGQGITVQFYELGVTLFDPNDKVDHRPGGGRVKKAHLFDGGPGSETFFRLAQQM